MLIGPYKISFVWWIQKFLITMNKFHLGHKAPYAKLSNNYRVFCSWGRIMYWGMCRKWNNSKNHIHLFQSIKNYIDIRVQTLQNNNLQVQTFHMSWFNFET